MRSACREDTLVHWEGSVSQRHTVGGCNQLKPTRRTYPLLCSLFVAERKISPRHALGARRALGIRLRHCPVACEENRLSRVFLRGERGLGREGTVVVGLRGSTVGITTCSQRGELYSLWQQKGCWVCLEHGETENEAALGRRPLSKSRGCICSHLVRCSPTETGQVDDAPCIGICFVPLPDLRRVAP